MASSMNSEYDIQPIQVNKYEEILEYLDNNLGGNYWVYRAQPCKVELETTFERECKRSNLDMKKAPDVEKEMIRQFTRIYEGGDRELVQTDLLYCLSLMRHFGAPSRLLDFTYSKYIAIYFALEYAYENVPISKGGTFDYAAERESAIWCVETQQLLNQGKSNSLNPELEDVMRLRSNDKTRNNSSFKRLYLKNNLFVGHETPVRLHDRLHIQQGTFLCPGDITVPFMNNLLLPLVRPKNCVKKLVCTFTVSALLNVLEIFRRMNITRESLFPGLDGFSQSIKYQLPFYSGLHNWRRSILSPL
jgi:hypothetical protein